MPIITIESGGLTDKQKDDLIGKMTDLASEITLIPKEFFFVVIRESSDRNIGIGGRSIGRIKESYNEPTNT